MKKIVGLVMVLFLSMVVSFPASGGEVLKKYMIAGKEFKVEKITEEPGKYWVYWGEEKMKWEPIIWMPDYEVKEGPLFYDRWIKPEAPFPWENSLEERVNWDAKKIMDKMHNVVWDFASCESYGSSWPEGVYDIRGRLRVKQAISWSRSYFIPETINLLPKDQQGVLRKKFLYTLYYPEDIKGMSGLSYQYMDRYKPDDIYFYLPSMRKAKRMSQGSRQDYVPGCILRNEDFTTTKPIHNYKVMRTELLKAPPKKYYPYSEKEWEEREVPTIRSVGEPCWVLEVTPAQKPWWFEKQIYWIGMKTLTKAYEESYDEKGRLIRVQSMGYFLPYPETHPYTLIWQNWCGDELLTGYKGFTVTGVDFKTPWGPVEIHLETKIPEQAFSQASLQLEPSTFWFWR